MVYCRFCKTTYNERSLCEIKAHDHACDPKQRGKYYNTALQDIEAEKKLLSQQLEMHSMQGNVAIATGSHAGDVSNNFDSHGSNLPTLQKRRTRSEKINLCSDNEDFSDDDDRKPAANEDTLSVNSTNTKDTADSNSDNASDSNSEESNNSNHLNEIDPFALDLQANPHSLRHLFDKANNQIRFYSDIEKSSLQLANILRSINAPLHTFDTVMRWVKSNSHVDLNHAPNYKSLIRKMAQRCGLEGTFPQTINVTLPSGNQKSITKFSFVSNLFSLLTDEDLMKPENLIFGNNPFQRVQDHGHDHVFDDIETSEWYLKTQRTYCTSTKDVLVPIILFIDKTQVKAKNIEPISFTLGIFKRHLRRTPLSWRNFGLIPGKVGDLESAETNIRSNKTSFHRIRDWHYVCEVLLKEFKTLQQYRDGIECYILGQYCRIKIPIMFMIGDIEGHDKVCTRKAGHGKYMRGVTHSCKVTREVCGNPGQSCEAVLKDEILNLQRKTLDPLLQKDLKKDAVESLNEYGYHSYVKNSFMELDYGDSLGGLHSACAVCLMHTFKQRFPGDVVELTFHLFGSNTDTTAAHMINRALTRLIPHISKQSDRSFPSVISSFAESFLNPHYTLSANEKFARLFPLLWFFNTSAGRKYVLDKKNTSFYDDSHVISIHRLIELSISLYQFLSQDRVKKEDIPFLKKAVSKFQSLYRDATLVRKEFIASRTAFGARKKSNTLLCEDDAVAESSKKQKTSPPISNAYDNPCQFPKFHYLGHCPHQIEMFGSTNNFNGDSCESNHKTISKATGLKTQGRSETFDEQTSQRFAENLVLDRSFRSSCIIGRRGSQTEQIAEPTFKFVEVHKESATFFAKLSNTGKIITRWKGNQQFPIEENVLQCIESKVFKEPTYNRNRKLSGHKILLKNVVLACYTTLNFGTCVLRAHPYYRKKPWFDYAMVIWHNQDGSYNYLCPAKILAFVHILNHPREHYPDGYYAVIHSTEFDESKKRPSQIAYNRWKEIGKSPFTRVWSFEKHLSMVHIDCIKRPCYTFPDFDNMDFKVPSSKFVFEVRTLKDWGKVHGIDRLTWGHES